jgi:hypothetical protein
MGSGVGRGVVASRAALPMGPGKDEIEKAAQRDEAAAEPPASVGGLKLPEEVSHSRSMPARAGGGKPSEGREVGAGLPIAGSNLVIEPRQRGEHSVSRLAFDLEYRPQPASGTVGRVQQGEVGTDVQHEEDGEDNHGNADPRHGTALHPPSMAGPAGGGKRRADLSGHSGFVDRLERQLA